MKEYRRTLPVLVLLVLLNGCAAQAQTIETEPPKLEATVPTEWSMASESEPPETEETIPARDTAEGAEPASVTEPTTPAGTEPNRETVSQHTTEPAATQPLATEPEETVPSATEPPATVPTETVPKDTEPEETIPPETSPPETELEQTEPPVTEGEVTTEPAEPEVTEYTYEFKREVAYYAALYLNQYRGTPCTVLPGMSQVAQYRAKQLTWNYAHSTSDKRAALAYYGYGRWIDATLAGLDESDSYYESDTTEAICRNFHGADAQALGKAIADLIYRSSSHWSYVGSSEYSYMGVGVEFNDGWYACVMVGTVNYG